MNSCKNYLSYQLHTGWSVKASNLLFMWWRSVRPAGSKIHLVLRARLREAHCVRASLASHWTGAAGRPLVSNKSSFWARVHRKKKNFPNPHATRGLSEWSGFVALKGIFKDLSPDKVLTKIFLKLTCAERVMILTSARTCN